MFKKVYYSLYIILALCGILYVTIRIFTIPVTCDEGWTYLEFMQQSVWDIMYGGRPIANNQILNTLLTKLTTTFSKHQFFLRLPNLLAFFLYIYSIYQLSRQIFTNKLVGLLLFATLIFNYTLLAFFGLCRGYGLSIALLMFSIYQLIKSFNTDQKDSSRSIHLSLIAAVLAVYSNFTVLYAIAAIFMISMYRQHILLRTKNIFRRHSLPILYGAIASVLCAYPLYRMYRAEEMYYGGEVGIIDDTLISGLSCWLGGIFVNDNQSILIYTSISVLLICTVIHLIFLFKRPKYRTSIPAIIFLFTISVILILFHTIQVRLPIDRTSLYLFPLMIIFVYSVIEHLSGILKWLAILPLLLITILGLYQFTKEMNIHTINLWWFDMHTREVLREIYNRSGSQNDKLKVYVLWPAHNSFNYYITTTVYKDHFEEVPCCTATDEIGDGSSYDYLYLNKHENMTPFPSFERIRAYHPDSVFVLYKNTSK